MTLADISREMSIRDMEAGTNGGLAAAFGEDGK
jgi:hypothetical protein